LFACHSKENSLRGAALVCGNDMLEPEDLLNRVAKTIEAAAAGIALVTFHNGRPLVCGHGAGAGVGEQVNEHIVSREQKHVVVSGGEQSLALSACGPADGFYTLDAKRFNDRADRHGAPQTCASPAGA